MKYLALKIKSPMENHQIFFGKSNAFFSVSGVWVFFENTEVIVVSK